jgi:recombination protein RecA
MSPVDISQRAAILSKLEKRAAKPGVDLGIHSGADGEVVGRIPTGSPMLDYATGGGIPERRWSRFYGGKSSGKSLLGWNIIREAQLKGLSCCYYNIEKQFEKDYTARCGVDVDELTIVEGTTIEDVGEALESLLGAYHVHVLDSCSEGVSLQELAAGYGDSLYAAKARAWGQVFYKVQRHFETQGEQANTIIYMDQIRDSFGQEQVHPPGGKIMEHRSSMTLYFRRGSWLYLDEEGRLTDEATGGRTISGYSEADGQECIVRVEKNRVSRPFRQARMRYYLDSARLDVPWELAECAAVLDVDGRYAHRSGKDVIFPKTTPQSSHYKMPDGATVNGASALAKRLAEDEELRDYVVGCLKRGY